MILKVVYVLVTLSVVDASLTVKDNGYDGYETVVDQRQNGELNIQVSVKDVEIIAMLNGGKEQYTDYDYTYDYAEMTIKPPYNTSTASHLNATSSNSSEATSLASSEPTHPPNEPITLTEGNLNSSANIENEQNITASSTFASPAAEVQPIVAIKIESHATTSSAVIEDAAGTAEKECRKGFHKNKKGDCELKLKPSSTNALLKLVELSQRLKLRRAN